MLFWLVISIGTEVSPTGLKTDAGASGKKRGGGGTWVRWLTHTGREVSPSGLKTDAGASGKKRGGGGWVRWLTHDRQGSVALWAEDRC